MKNTVLDRFWSKVLVLESDSCWEWKAVKTKEGYGKFFLHHSVSVLSHRFSYEVYNSPIPDGMFVCHKCDNPSCVNPNHLFLGTRNDNSQDMVNKGRSLKGERNPKSKLTVDDVKQIRIMLKENKIPQQQIAQMFGVKQPAISFIKTEKYWRES